jgi:hypothetical protein
MYLEWKGHTILGSYTVATLMCARVSMHKDFPKETGLAMNPGVSLYE